MKTHPTAHHLTPRLSTRRPAGTLVLAVLTAAALAACGGGNEDDADTNASLEVAQSTGATAGVVPDEASAATSEVVAVTRTLASAANGSASLTLACAGGGSATYAVTGTGLALPTLTNGQFDAGERYSLTLVNCKGANGAATVNGSYTLDVVSTTAGGFVVNTAAGANNDNVTVTLPRSTITINGSSNWTQNSVTAGTQVTTTTRWITTTDHVVKVVRNGRERSHTLSDVDLTRGFTTNAGVLQGSTLTGRATLTSVWPNGRYSITFNTDSTVSYDAAGNPTQGAWTVTLPNNIVSFAIVGDTATVKIDYGANGSWDRTISWTVPALVDQGT